MIVGFSVAACSGVFAALASVFSKVALEDGGILIRTVICPWIKDEYCDMVSILCILKFINTFNTNPEILYYTYSISSLSYLKCSSLVLYVS